jgi:branched-chain amino acid transport system substrate-binding protein
MSRRFLFLLCVLLTLALGVSAVAAQDAGSMTVTVKSGNQVVIGLAAALSGEGLAPFGEDIKRGAELALDDRPTVTVGGKEFKVTLDSQDDTCSAEGGQAVASRFVADPNIVAVVGPMCSSACTSAAPVLDQNGYSSISPSCTAPTLTTSNYTSFNRSVVSDGFQGKIAAEFIYNKLGIKNVATIHDGSPYGEGLVSVMSQHFEELGGKIVKADAVNVGDTDFRSLLEDIASAKPELIYFGGFAAEGARLVQQRKDAGLENVVFMGADGIKGGEFPKLAGADAEGVYTSSAIPSEGNKEAVDKVLANYKSKYGLDPTGPFWPNTYDATNMVLDGIEAVGKVSDSGDLTIDRKALSEYIRSIKNFNGLTGTLNCDGTGECSVADIGIAEYDASGNLNTVQIGQPQTDGSIKLIDPSEMATPEASESATPEATASS